ncbi:MAG: glycosyltransferase family 39 protein [Chloroflexi bacterium]|nr:glycosyltransferase family 39 protein [Chloroflexota bacterium]
MNARIVIALFLLGASASAVIASFQRTPGYMDAEYYYAAGRRLVEGGGFSEEILWNYLDDPQGLPHPSHGYWSPLVSLAAAAGMFLAGDAGFDAAQGAMIVIAGLTAAATGALALRLTGRREAAWLAGLLAVFPGFYASYLPTTDAFGVYALLGASACLLADRLARDSRARWAALLGMIFGLFHLARADGALWLVAGLLALPRRSAGEFARFALLIAFGYLLIMGGWLARNWTEFGSLLAPGGARMLWLLEYDELFSYPAALLTPERWLASGWLEIVRARGYALWQNLQTALVVQGEIFLWPLALAGLWRLRGRRLVSMGAAAWTLALMLMTLVFPFAGWRGGFFHAGAAIQPLIWAATPLGLERFIAWGERARGWNGVQARRVFSAGLVALALMLSVLTVRSRVTGGSLSQPAWNRGGEFAIQQEEALRGYGAQEGEIVLVNNAPGYYAANRRPAISIPDGGIETSLAVAARYGGRYLVLEVNHARGLDELYLKPRDLPGLRYLGSRGGARIFRIEGGPGE